MRISDWSSDVCSSDLLHGINTFAHQPAKIAAIEGHWEARQEGAPLILFGLPDDEAEETRYRIELPNLGSLILTHEWNGVVAGLKAWPKEERPPSEIVFWSFRLMVALGFAMAALGLWSLVARLRGSLYEGRRSEEHTSELQSLMRISYAVFCLKK